MQRQVMTPKELDTLVSYLRNAPMPFTVSVAKGKIRTDKQNRLQRKWLIEIAEQLGDRTTEQVRGEIKLHIGVPILRNENAKFAEKYDSMIKPLPYEIKLAMMIEPFDFAVTRNMTTKQKAHFLDETVRYWAERGIVLTDPERQDA